MLPIPDALAGLPAGGDEGNRTLDPLLAGQVLSQLSYTPVSGFVLFAVLLLKNRLSALSFKIEQQRNYFLSFLPVGSLLQYSNPPLRSFYLLCGVTLFSIERR